MTHTNTTERDRWYVCGWCGAFYACRVNEPKPIRCSCAGMSSIAPWHKVKLPKGYEIARTANASEASAPDALLVGLADSVKEASEDGGHWRSCSGCYETEDGVPPMSMQYSYSTLLGCILGLGCHECGGIGAVWELPVSDDDAREMLAAPPSDRAAVEGVSEAMENALHRAYWGAYHEAHMRAGRTIGGHAAGIRAVISEYERARASDTNAAAAPVGQAVEINPHFWIRAIRNAAHCTDCNDKVRTLLNAANELEKYANNAPPTPRAAYRRPTSNDAFKICDEYEQIPFGDAEVQHMLAALNSIGAVIAEEVPK